MIELPANTERWCLTGSHYICNPPVENTDRDVAIYVRQANFLDYQLDLIRDGWEVGGSRGLANDVWASYKKRIDGVLWNFIVTNDEFLFDNWRLATAIAKRLNLREKVDRVMLFHAVVDGIMPEEEVAMEVVPF